MTAAPTPVAPPASPVSGDVPRLLLFGLPDSGKSSLLGALARAAELHERVLGARLSEAGQGLADLRRQTYESGLHETREELAAYPVRLQPFESEAGGARPATDIVLLDCDGRKASEILERRGGLPETAQAGTLAEQVRQADAILLLIDASAPWSQVEGDFAEFLRFLRSFRTLRARSADVAGLPLWLVLAKCDRLAKPGDTLAVWTERVEARKDEASLRFEEFLKESGDANFGSLKFATAAVAIKQPPVANAAPRDDEPLGVAELFRDAMAAAQSFHSRRDRSDHRARGLFRAAAILLALLAGFVAWQALQRTLLKPPEIVARLEKYRETEGSGGAAYLQEPTEPRLVELESISRENDFTALPEVDRDFVVSRIGELRAYRDYHKRLLDAAAPINEVSLRRVIEIESLWRDDLVIPAGRRESWEATPAGQLRMRRIAEATAFRKAIEAVVAAYQARAAKAQELYLTPGTSDGEWGAIGGKIQALLEESERPPVAESEPISGWPAAETTPKMAAVFKCTEVQNAHTKSIPDLDRLRAARDLARIVGLFEGRGPTLRVGDGFAVEQAPALLQQLSAGYNRWEQFSKADVSDNWWPWVEKAAQTTYQRLLPSARAFVTRALPAAGGTDSAERWQQASGKLVGNEGMQAWNELAMAAGRAGGKSRDPVSEFRDFVRAGEFTIAPQRVTLRMPSHLHDKPLAPAGSLTINVQGTRGSLSKLLLKMPPGADGKPVFGEQYAFASPEAKSLRFRPGDDCWAELELIDSSGASWQLSWIAAVDGLAPFKLARLSLVPWLHKIDQRPEQGRQAVGVQLEFAPAGSVPRLPDLFPVAR